MQDTFGVHVSMVNDTIVFSAKQEQRGPRSPWMLNDLRDSRLSWKLNRAHYRRTEARSLDRDPFAIACKCA